MVGVVEEVGVVWRRNGSCRSEDGSRKLALDAWVAF